MGPGAPPAPAQERRAPTIGAAMLPTGSGPAPTRLLSYDQCQWRTGESTKKCIQDSAAQDEGTGSLASIEHSLMNTKESP